jgi:hypothetical protein
MVRAGRTYRLVGGSDPFDPQGRPSFQLLQNNQSRALPVYFYAFDLLNRNGEPLVSLAIERRRELMGRLLAAAEDPLRLSPLLRAPSGQVLGAVCKLGLEGGSSSLPPLARYFSARRPEKARLIHPARIFRVSSTNNVMPEAKSARKPNAALMKPVQPDDALAKIVGSTPLPRSEMTKKIWDYIEEQIAGRKEKDPDQC